MTPLAILVMLASPLAPVTAHEAVHYWAVVWGVPMAIADRIAMAESSYYPEAENEIARGLFALKRTDEAWLVNTYATGSFDWRKASDSARVGLAYLAALKKRFGTWKLAVTAYHMGPNALARGDAPGPRTIEYVGRVFL